MKKVIKPIIAAAFATLLMAVFTLETNTNNLETNQVQATSQTIPKKMRGTWKSKPTYMGEMKHINKNISVPAMKMKVSAKKVKWHFIGYVPKGYNHQSHTINLVSLENGQALFLGYHGGAIDFFRVKK